MADILTSGTQQGSFTSTGVAKTLRLRSGVDWMRVYNITVADADQTTAIGVEYYWQKGFADGRGIEYKKSNAANAANLEDYMATGGFTYVDTSLNPNGLLNATVTAVSNATPPVVTNTGVNGLVAGDIVRMINVAGAQQIGGFDFTVGSGSLTDTTFSLEYMRPIVAGTTGSWMKIKWDPIFYPRYRYITKVIVATSGTAGTGNPAVTAQQAIVTLSVTHGYLVGQKIRFQVPRVTALAYGMTQLDGLTGTIIAIGDQDANGKTNTIRVDIDVSTFTAFAFPLTADVPFVAAITIPVGENTAEADFAGVNRYNDAEENQAYIGMNLAAGANSPAGQSGNVIYWVAGVSFNVDNQ